MSVILFLTFSGATVFKVEDGVLLKILTISFTEQPYLYDSNYVIILENFASALPPKSLFWTRTSPLVCWV